MASPRSPLNQQQNVRIWTGQAATTRRRRDEGSDSQANKEDQSGHKEKGCHADSRGEDKNEEVHVPSLAWPP